MTLGRIITKRLLHKPIRINKPKNVEMLRILQKVPQFVWIPKGRDFIFKEKIKAGDEELEFEVYGPFEPEEMVIVPKDVANALVEAGVAEKIRIKI